MKENIYLHTNTEYSFLHSTIRLEELFKLAKQKKVKYLTLTDIENFHALQFFWNFSEEYNFKLIIGVELKLIEKFKVIAIAKNDNGFLFLKKLVLEKSYGKEISYYDLENEDIYLIDHFEEGFFRNNINLKKMLNNFYINSKEPQFHQTVFAPTKRILSFDDNELLPVLENIATGKSEVKKIYNEYFDDSEFEGLNDSVYQNMINIVESINITKPSKEIKLAKFNENSIELFQKLITGTRYHNLLKKYDKNLVNERIKKEYKVITKLGFVDYFLIIHDVLDFASKNNILIGPGRGSAAGSLISYLLNITSVNPLEFNLLFERFLNEDRISLPDIDIDIQDNRRDEIFRYLQEKYGAEKVAFISTFQTLASKNSIRDVGRYLDIPRTEIDNISSSISIKDENLLYSYANNKKYNLYANKYPKLHSLASRIEGLPRQIGVHAAGFIISDRDLSEVVPMQASSFGLNQVQMTMNNLEKYGLIKIDFLGLKNLTFISEIEKLIPYESRFDQVTNDSISLFNDKRTFDLLNSLKTDGIFQLESPGMRNAIKQVSIDSFDDIYAILSLFRPGPSVYIPVYAKGKKNPLLVEKVHPKYDAIVKNTFGIIVYQEQIMQIVQDVAGMPFSKADLFRRAISKKNEEELHKYKSDFFEGGLKNGLSKADLEKIYANIEKFADYGFNKSHAVAYAIVSYKLAYYKARFPMIFYKVLLSNGAADQQNIKLYAEEAALSEIKIKVPNINISSNEAEIFFDEIFLPFNTIKGIGHSAVEKIIQERKRAGGFIDFVSAWMRLRVAGVGESVIETLIKAGSFSDFGNINTLLTATDMCLDFYELFKSETKKSNNPIEFLDDFIEKQNFEKIEFIKQEDDMDLQDQWEIKLLGSRYTNEKWVTENSKDVFEGRISLANLGEEPLWLKIEILEAKKGTKDRQTNLKIKDETKVVTAYGWTNKIMELINSEMPRKIVILVVKKDNKFYNIKDFKEIINE
ncbi:DNA polymerase III DnaE [Mycoplasmopsis canis PG 14]|uniref:DNA-directed DNA polymerase n=1 Tax=Mycoplasmopsis canis TaxID=29555 RepID=A0A449AQV5_9BACT|nr:DNA polymerase III subunit alpha [Mycoplasmopsis canis]AMD81048.1 DNA polymerase III subunit alpha [Mycoplasmopsis canis PG 14]EIE39893.1 DNA polymerase III DnaE [Mycoplasmopsis canis PG 14]VEU68860.1 DNA polymerase III alpha subunit [Mycoplasmopsis canis]